MKAISGLRYSFLVAFSAVLVAIISRGLIGSGLIAYNDASYQVNASSNLGESVSTWTSNYFGQAQTTNLFIYLAKGVPAWGLEHLGFSTAASSYALSFGWLFVMAATAGCVFSYISGSLLFGVFSLLFVVLNNETLENILYGGFFYYCSGVTALIALVGIAVRVLETGRWSWVTTSAVVLVSALAVHPFFLTLYGLALVALVLVQFRRQGRSVSVKLISSVAGIPLLAAYWLLPLALGALRHGATATYQNGNGNGVLAGYKSHSGYLSLVNLFQYFGEAQKLHGGSAQYVFYFVSFAATIALATQGRLSRSVVTRQPVVLLGLALCSFANLALGPRSGLTGHLWSSAIAGIPVFGFFRSFTRTLAAVLVLMLATWALAKRADGGQRGGGRFLVALAISAVLATNSIFFSGDLGGSVGAVTVPADYKLASNLLDRAHETGAVISLPSAPSERYTWSTTSNATVIAQDYYLQDSLFARPVAYNRDSLGLANMNADFRGLFAGPYNDGTLDTLRQDGFRFVILHKDLLGPTLHPISPSSEKTLLDSRATRILDGPNISLYRLKEASKSVVGPGVSWRLNATHYVVKVHLGAQPVNLTFLQNYNPGWKAYLLPPGTAPHCTTSRDALWPKAGTAVACPGAAVDPLRDLAPLRMPALPETSHSISRGWANSWTISRSIVDQDSKTVRNADGSEDVTVALWFRPQAHFAVGVLVSVLTALLLAATFTLGFLRRKNQSGRGRSSFRCPLAPKATGYVPDGSNALPEEEDPTRSNPVATLLPRLRTSRAIRSVLLVVGLVVIRADAITLLIGCYGAACYALRTRMALAVPLALSFIAVACLTLAVGRNDVVEVALSGAWCAFTVALLGRLREQSQLKERIAGALIAGMRFKRITDPNRRSRI